MLGKTFKHLKCKSFCTAIPEVHSEINIINILNTYLKESLFSINKKNLKEPQINIIESISKSAPSMILCDDYSGRKYSCMLGIMNRIINKNEVAASGEDSEEYFVNTVDAYKKKKENIVRNLDKKERTPKGALIICQKFEFATHFYRICRRLDYKKRLRMVRVGTSLHTVAPTVEIDDKSISDSGEQSELEKKEMLIGNVNLINTTDWKHIDMLFITPQMLEYVLGQKDEYDYFDINPEVIMVDDFDYVINSTKYDLKKCLSRFFSRDSRFPATANDQRKLILTSSSIQMESFSSPKTSLNEKVETSMEAYKNYLLNINRDFHLETVISPFFMNLDYHLKEIKIFLKHFEGIGKSLSDKKLKSLQTLLDSETGQTVICCSDASIQQLKDFCKRRRLQFTSVDESDRVGQRLFSIMLYNKYDYNLLLITPIFLKSLNIVKMKRMVIYDLIQDQKDLIRILAKFPKSEEEIEAGSLHVFCDSEDTEKSGNIIEYLSKINKK